MLAVMQNNWYAVVSKVLARANKMEVRSHVMLQIVIGYLLHITFEKYWSHDLRLKCGVERTLETTVIMMAYNNYNIE